LAANGICSIVTVSGLVSVDSPIPYTSIICSLVVVLSNEIHEFIVFTRTNDIGYYGVTKLLYTLSF